MKLFTTLKTLTIAAGMMLALNLNAQDAKKPSSGDLVISKVFHAASKKTGGSGNYLFGQFVEIYNNSENVMDITGLYLALIESESSTSSYTLADLEADATAKEVVGSKMVAKQIFQIPTDKTYTLEPGKTLVICNSAIDHTTKAVIGHDLSTADFEVKTTAANYEHNENVPAMTQIFTMTATLTQMNLMQTGPASVVLLKNHESAFNLENTIYGRGKTTGNKFVLVNPYYAIDVVEIVKAGADATQKRISATYDAGFTSTAAYTGGVVYRKTAYVLPDGRKVLYDTNNSSVDFTASTTIQPHAFDAEPSGLSDGPEFTIPATGYGIVKADKSFCGPSNVIFVYASLNQKNSDVVYNRVIGNETLLDKSSETSRYIVVGHPGTYKLTYSEAQAVKKVTSNGFSWCDDDSKELTGSQASRSIYKFVNTTEKVGFQRVPAKDGKYNYAEFSGNDRLYMTLTEEMGKKFYEANGASSAADFDWIQWHGPTPGDVSGIETVQSSKLTKADGTIYNLQGVRLNQLQKGLNIVNGKKVVMK